MTRKRKEKTEKKKTSFAKVPQANIVRRRKCNVKLD